MGYRYKYKNDPKLIDAVKGVDPDKVADLLKGKGLRPGLNADRTGDGGETALHVAAERGLTKIVATLISGGASVDMPDDEGRTPLMRAVLKDEPEGVAAMLAGGANPDAPDKKGVTPLIRAAEADAGGMVAALLAGNAAIDGADADGRTALMAAAKKGHALLVGKLSGAGASCTARDNKGNTPLHYAAQRPENDVTLQFLAGKADLINTANDAGETPIIVAVKLHNTENAQALVDLGADARIADKSGMNVFDHARASKRVKFRQAMTEMLEGQVAKREMQKGADNKVSVMKPLRLKKPGPV